MIAINIREEDAVIAVALTNGEDEVVVASRNGKAVRFSEDQVRPMGRNSTGVQSIILDGDDDAVVGMAVINDVENEKILVISDQGFGKRTDVEEYRRTNRHAKGVKTLNVTDKTGKVVALLVTKEEEDLMIINKSGTTIRLHMDVIKETKNRVTQGTKVIELKKRNDQISHVCIVPREDDEENVQSGDDMPEGAAETVGNPNEE